MEQVGQNYQNKALQYDAELNAFIALLQREGVKSYLEIGSRFGGSLWRIANALPVGSLIVSVDMPTGKIISIVQSSLQQCVDAINETGRTAKLFLGDSKNEDIISEVKKLGPFDACLIDGDHYKPGIISDWENYGAMSRIVAFHDISWKRPKEFNAYRIEVPEIWHTLRKQFRHEEIRLDPTGQDNGFGVLWRY